jgi:thiosulfate/3-mercaptopyruvate sulfurtransferase
MTKHSPLVSVEWLRGRLHDESIVVLDATVYIDPAPEGRARGEFRSGLDQYIESGHIPGSRFADLFTEFSDPTSRLPFTRPQEKQFAEAAGRLGITADTHVVTYDNLVGQWAARLWWVFRTLGHTRVSVLDGGLRKYLANGGVLENGITPYQKTIYAGSGTNKPYARKEQIADIVAGRSGGTLVCLLQPEDFSGAISVRGRPGHIPGSVNLPFTRLVSEKDNTLLPPDKLKAAFRSVTKLDGELVVTYCGGGIASTLGALALAVVGYENTLEYDGSLAEWISDLALPMTTGDQ